MQRRDAYSEAVHIGGASPRETELLAFGLCNARLRKAADSRSRIDALSKTHQLWSMLVRDLACDGNRMPEPLKQELIDLGFWAMRYCILAASKGLELQPLISVNENILEGLRAQAAPRMAAGSAEKGVPITAHA